MRDYSSSESDDELEVRARSVAVSSSLPTPSPSLSPPPAQQVTVNDFLDLNDTSSSIPLRVQARQGKANHTYRERDRSHPASTTAAVAVLAEEEAEESSPVQGPRRSKRVRQNRFRLTGEWRSGVDSEDESQERPRRKVPYYLGMEDSSPAGGNADDFQPVEPNAKERQRRPTLAAPYAKQARNFVPLEMGSANNSNSSLPISESLRVPTETPQPPKRKRKRRRQEEVASHGRTIPLQDPNRKARAPFLASFDKTAFAPSSRLHRPD